MLCKISKNSQNWVTRDKTNEIKSKLACILEGNESTRLRMVESLPHHHDDHIAGKGENSLQHCNLVHKFIPVLQALKISAAKAAADKEWEKLEKISAWNLTKVRCKTGDQWSKDVGRYSSFCIINGHMSSEKCWIGGTKKTKVELYSEVIL